MKNIRIKFVRVCLLVLIMLIFSSACTRIGADLDPATLGYEVEVTYNALGGLINQREIRNTNYAQNSLLFEPRGSSNLLVEPIKLGYTLAGWYTDAKEITNENGETEYEFDAQDRWDFKVDRVQENTTLYARWVNQATANYIDSETEEVLFSKDLTPSSPFSPLSNAIMKLIGSEDKTFVGYFDENLEEEINFDNYEYTPLLPSEEVLYNMLAEEFPENFKEYVPDEEEETAITETQVAEGEEIDPDAVVEQEEIAEDTSFQFLHQYGLELDADEAVQAEIRTRKNEIIDEYISKYIENNAHNNVYLKFEDGKKITVQDNEGMKTGGKYTFVDVGQEGEYLFESDLNLGDSTFQPATAFSGTIDGQNHVLDNIHLKVRVARRDMRQGVKVALFESLENATIKNITFRNMIIEIEAPNGAKVDAAAIAVDAANTTFENVMIDGLTITTGDGPSDKSVFRISDFILNSENVSTDGVTGQNINLEVAPEAELNLIF